MVSSVVSEVEVYQSQGEIYVRMVLLLLKAA